jgi:hypothetical protein
MGIRPSMQKVLKKFVLRSPSLSVCELGDQYAGVRGGKPMLAREMYLTAGCARYVSIDANGRGDVAHDLNKPIEGLGQFDVVTDFGTGEHVWNQSQVWETVHDLTKAGGFIVFDRPYQGYGGHCFYLTQPATIAALVHANGYEVVWFGRALTTRGELIRGVLRKRSDDQFVVPQQGRYFGHLMPQFNNVRMADHKNGNLRTMGVVGKMLAPPADERTDKGIFDWEPEELDAVESSQ